VVVAENKNPPRTNLVVATRSPVVTPRPPVVVKNPPATQVVPVKPEEKIAAPPKTSEPPTAESIELPIPDEPEKKGFFSRWFGGANPAPKTDDRTKSFNAKKLTPLPPGSNDDASLTPTKPAIETPPPEPVRILRYVYLSPGKPEAGDRRSASGAFTKAREYEQEENWVTAMRWYQQAAEMDPSWFEAQFNTGVLAHRLRNFPLALPCYENALAIQPESVDTRYNFALALKAAGFPLDAAAELKKILAIDAKEVRAQLALANLCSKELREPTQARQHYLQVLALDPDNAQAASIREWLQAHP
jgi:tetratricopeptide (TPR) repeat protein